MTAALRQRMPGSRHPRREGPREFVFKDERESNLEALAVSARRKQAAGTREDVTCAASRRCRRSLGTSPTVELFLALERNPLEGVRKLFKGFFIIIPFQSDPIKKTKGP